MKWSVNKKESGEPARFASAANNIAVIQIARGTNGRVRFDLSLRPVAGGRRLFTKELQLR